MRSLLTLLSDREVDMESARSEYLNGIYKRFQYLATWLPNTTVHIGDIGIQDENGFKRMGTLQELKVPFQVRRGEAKVDFTYTSESGVILKTKLAGEPALGTMLPLGEAGVSLQFSKEGAYLFQAVGCTIDEIEDKIALGRSVLKLYREHDWQEDWTVVDTVVSADSATIVVSNSANSALDLTAKGPVSLNSLANVDAGLSVCSQSGDVIRVIAERGLAPLFKLSRVKRSLVRSLLHSSKAIAFGGPTTNHVSSSDGELLEEVPPEHYQMA
jgi:hypothetical protein